MNKNTSAYSILLVVQFLTCCCLTARSQNRYELDKGWLCMQAAKVKEDGTLLSSSAYSISRWKPAVVPGTVLTTMLHNKEIPDPFYGMNNQHIPDIYTTGRDYYTYWFIKEFTERFPAKGQQVWLQFRGVNYGCDIYLNGHRLNDNTHKGMYLRQQYNISAYLLRSGRNRLAVIVYPPDPVGNPNGGQGGDGTIAKNVALQYVAGWDWIQPIRDRNTGIWDKVFIERTGVVNMQNPHVVTLVPGTRTPGTIQEPSIIQVSAELQNVSDTIVHGVLKYSLAGSVISKKVILPSNSTTTVSLSDYTMKNPELWWPNGYGKQHLYNIELQFVEGNRLSDKEAVSFGIREIRREWNTVTSSSQFSVNGQKIFIKGGNWIVSDAMLRLSAQRYDAEIRFHRDMNLNLIRIWGGALLERPEFYAACDKYGLLVFQDFWMSGDCNGRWNDRMKLDSRQVRRQYPDDHALFIRSVADGIKLIRNHASLAIWCGGNEITPPDDILRVMKDSLFSRLDGTRYFFDYSNSDSMSQNILHGGGDGPYSIQPVDTFWTFRTYPFNSEIGSVGMSDYESLERFIPKENMHLPEYEPPAAGTKATEKTDSVWNYHKYIGYEKYIDAYGKAKDVKDFALKAQLVNYNQYRALMEGFSAHMWEWYTGSIIWKTQNPWTAMRGQMYDYYLDPNACLYGLRSGSEPVHVMYNPVTGSPMVVNNTGKTMHFTLEIKAYHTDGKPGSLQQYPITTAPSSVQSYGTIKTAIDSLTKTAGAFLLLRLTGNNKNIATENFYWLPDQNRQYTGLQHMRSAGIITAAKRTGPGRIEVTISNPECGPIAFFTRVSLINAQTTKRILPVFYSDNYISVLPGEEKKVNLDYTPSATKTAVSVSGWNTGTQTIVIR